MKNWKTTAAGMAAAILGYIVLHPTDFSSVVVQLAAYAQPAAIFFVGFFSKDAPAQTPLSGETSPSQ